MKTKKKSIVRRTQRDYNLSFKLSIVRQVEEGEMTYLQAQRSYGIQGKSTVLVWLRKHGKLDWTKPSLHTMSLPRRKETPAQQIKRLEKELADEKLRNEILNTMIDISDQQYGTAIRKKFSPKQFENFSKKEK